MPDLAQNHNAVTGGSNLEDQVNLIGLLQELVIAAQRAGLSVESVNSLLVASWANPTDASGLSPDENGDLWYSDGLSQPDGQGLVRIRQLEELKEKYSQEGKKFAADYIKGKFSCIAALEHIKDEKSLQAAAVITNTGHGRFLNGMGLVGGWLVYECVPNPALTQGNPDYPYNPYAPPFWIERRSKFNAKPIPDAFCVPDTVKTVKATIAYVKKGAEDTQAFEDNRDTSGRGFSPAP